MNPSLYDLAERMLGRVRTFRNARMVDALRSCLASCGPEVLIDPSVVVVAASNVHIGAHVLIGPGVWISAIHTSVIIGDHVMMAPQVALIAGDHNTSVVERFMDEVEDKRPEDDQPIIIEDEVWLGMRAIVMKGVTVGRGSVVSAGSVVTRDVAPYSVVAGVPARAIRARFNGEQIERHELALYGRVLTTPEALANSLHETP
jgi:acetyltransferase-like isoleucine patch superfamily enzyme